MNNTLKEIIRYVFFGITTTAVNLAVFYFLKKSGMTQTDTGLTVANGIAWVIAVTYAYITNKLWVFESKNKELMFVLKEAASFFLGRAFSGLFEIFLPTLLTKLITKGITFSLVGKVFYFDEQWIAKITVSVIVIVLNYIISKLLVFRKKD